MKTLPRTPLCPGCAETVELVVRIDASMEQGEFDPETVLHDLPLLLESIAGYLLSEFDYEAHPHSNTAKGLRLLAQGIVQVNAMHERWRYPKE